MANTVLDIDDLTAPVLDPIQRQVLEQLDAVSVELDPATLIDEAIERTGLDEFGPGDFRRSTRRVRRRSRCRYRQHKSEPTDRA